MSDWKFSRRSYDRMVGVRPELTHVACKALDLSIVDFGITEGVRTKERQAQLVASGASRTMNSRHLTGHAIDVMAYVDGAGRWDWPLYEQISHAFKEASQQLGIPIVWGGDWTSLRDGPHYELDRRRYP